MTSAAVSAQGVTHEMSAGPAGPGTGSPSVWVNLNEIVTFQRSGDRPEIDVSSLDSLAREFRLGLKDEGTYSFECMYSDNSTGQARLRAALSEDDPSEFRVTYPNGDLRLFQALVKKVDESGGVDDVIRCQVELRITGPIAFV
jgi:hypothetical protein